MINLALFVIAFSISTRSLTDSPRSSDLLRHIQAAAERGGEKTYKLSLSSLSKFPSSEKYLP